MTYISLKIIIVLIFFLDMLNCDLYSHFLNVLKTLRFLLNFFFSCKFSRSEEHTSELQSQSNLVCRLLLEKKKKHLLHVIIDRPPPPPCPVARRHILFRPSLSSTTTPTHLATHAARSVSSVHATAVRTPRR